jgi:hypothetical protein
MFELIHNLLSLRGFFSCRSSDPDSDMAEGKGISWLVCTGEGRAYLRECDVVLALGDGSTAVLYMTLRQ